MPQYSEFVVDDDMLRHSRHVLYKDKSRGYYQGRQEALEEAIQILVAYPDIPFVSQVLICQAAATQEKLQSFED